MKVYLYTILGGGAERISELLARTLPGGGQWHVAAAAGVPEFFPPQRVEILKRAHRASVPVEVARWIPALFRLHRSVRRVRPDVMLVSGFQMLIALLRQVGAIAAPVATIVHAPPSNDATSPEFSALRRRLMQGASRLFLRRCEMVIAVSRATRDDLVATYAVPADRIRVIPNPVDHARIDELRAAPLSEDEEVLFSHPVVCTVGRLTDPKGQWHLIRAFQAVRASHPDARLLLVGGGELAGYLRALIGECGLADAVTLYGFDRNPSRLVARSACFVLSSLREGFPVAMLEAMACGVPVIASDCVSGPRELLAAELPSAPVTAATPCKGGILVPVCDGARHHARDPLTREETVLAEAISALLSDAEARTRMGREARARSLDFSTDALLPLYTSALEALVQGASTSGRGAV